MKDVVKLTAYLTDFSLFAGYAQARREVFPEPTFVGTGVEVKGLVSPDLLLEVEAVAEV
jgi:enamine deaminase RidA (YjgF/YER057c/UK114 family)